VHLLAHIWNARGFIADDAEAVTELHGQMHRRLSGADHRYAHQVSRQLDSGIEGAERHDGVEAMGFGFLRYFSDQWAGGQRVDLRVGTHEESSLDDVEGDIRSRRRALEHGGAAPFLFFGRVFTHDNHDFHRALLGMSLR
jgi:hypothetical protein